MGINHGTNHLPLPLHGQPNLVEDVMPHHIATPVNMISFHWQTQPPLLPLSRHSRGGVAVGGSGG